MKKPLLLSLGLLLLFWHITVRAQTYTYIPEKPDVTFLQQLSATCKERYTAEIQALPAKNKKDYLELYEERWTGIKERFDGKEIYTGSAAREYLNRVRAEIVRGNPSLKQLTFDCYFSRTAIPNASYIGHGMILFNMGLFSRLRTESEAAFVLCHEIAHCLLRHTENGINNYVVTLNSAEVQAELRKIKGSEYHKKEQLQKLVKGLTFDSRRHSRDHEGQADSMAVELMKHTRFALGGALSALALLDVIDTDSLHTADCLRRFFNAPDYPFQQKWIAKDGGLLGGHARIKDEEMADSLKTHPDCQARIKALEPAVLRAAQPGAGAFIIDSSRFRSLQESFRFEAIEYAYESNKYTRCLFLTLESLDKRPADPYLVTQVGKVLNGLYLAQKAHTLSKVTALPSPDYRANYNLLLQFVQNLYLENIAAINYYYLRQHHPAMSSYAPFHEAYQQSENFFHL